MADPTWDRSRPRWDSGQQRLDGSATVISGTAATAQAERVAALASEIITGIETSAEAQTLAEAGIETIAGTVATAEGQSAFATGGELLPVTGTAATAQGETLDAFDRTVTHITGGGGSTVRFYGRTVTYPRVEEQAPPEIIGRANTAQSAHTRAVGEASALIQGSGVSSSAQTSVCLGTVDNRKPTNLRRARMLIELYKAAA